jgi:hypothetical protein
VRLYGNVCGICVCLAAFWFILAAKVIRSATESLRFPPSKYYPARESCYRDSVIRVGSDINNVIETVFPPIFVDGAGYREDAEETATAFADAAFRGLIPNRGRNVPMT